MKRNLLTVWAKRVVLALALTLTGAAGLMLPSCEKEPKPTEIVYPYRDPYEKTLWFSSEEPDSIQPKIIKYFANDPACTHIYLTLTAKARDDALPSSFITNVRKELQKRVEISPKVSGRGDWWFQSGNALPADSLWFVQNGWTVNQIKH